MPGGGPGGGPGGSNPDNVITINGYTNYPDNKQHVYPLAYLRNAPVNATVQTPMMAPTLDVVIHRPLPPVTIDLPDIKVDPVYLVCLNLDFAYFGGYGGQIDVVFLNTGSDRGIYFYGGGDVNAGYGLGGGVAGAEIHFNQNLGVPLDRHAFEGWSMALSGGYGIASGTFVYAYTDSKVHIPFKPGNPPVLYWGLLEGLSKGYLKGEVGGMGTISRAYLFNKLSIKY